MNFLIFFAHVIGQDSDYNEHLNCTTRFVAKIN